MDFVTGLPECEGFNAIMIVADRLGKLRHLIPCRDTVDSKYTAQLYIRQIWKHHGLPKRIVSDRGTQFIADFWQAVTTLGARTPAPQSLLFSPLSRYAFPRFLPLLVILSMVRVATQQWLSHMHVTHARVSHTW